MSSLASSSSSPPPAKSAKTSHSPAGEGTPPPPSTAEGAAGATTWGADKAKVAAMTKELRRMRRRKAPPEEKKALEAQITALKAALNEIENLKCAITVKTKARRALDGEDGGAADAAAAAALDAEIEELRARYRERTGEEYHRSSQRRARAPPKEKVDPMTPPPPASSFPPRQPRDFFRFELVHQSRKPGSRARVGRIHTPHGVIETPAFVPVGTNGALKAVDSVQAEATGVQLMFANTYHLLVHPGPAVVAKAGGLHKFMKRNGPIITDSGGFQVFSLAGTSEEDGPELKKKRKRTSANGQAESGGSLVKLDEEGTVFRSYFDGSLIPLTPESSVQAQKALGADIIIPLDELPPYHVTTERLAASVALSHRWMARSLREHLKDPRQQAMYGVVHGGTNKELRKQSVDYLASLPFDGLAIGGSLGQDREEMVKLLTWLMPHLPADRPNHLLGIADEASAEAVVPLGVDTMDSCNPTRIARHGSLMVRGAPGGLISIKSGQYVDDFGAIDPSLDTIPYTRAYLHHLFKQNEPLALTLASLHNLHYMNDLMARMRQQILNDEI